MSYGLADGSPARSLTDPVAGAFADSTAHFVTDVPAAFLVASWEMWIELTAKTKPSCVVARQSSWSVEG